MPLKHPSKNSAFGRLNDKPVGIPLKKAEGGLVEDAQDRPVLRHAVSDVAVLRRAQDPAWGPYLERQAITDAARARHNERIQNIQDLEAAVNTLRAQENTVVRRKPEKPVQRKDLPEIRAWNGDPGRSRADTLREGLEKAFVKPVILGTSLPMAAAVPTTAAGRLVGGAAGAALGGVSGEDPYFSALSMLHPALAAAQLGHAMYGKEAPLVPMSEAEAGGLNLYRGIPRMAREMFEGITGLQQQGRSLKGVPSTKANVGKYIWTSDNPNIASSYAHTGGVVVPLRMDSPPDVVLDAKGANWEDYFFPKSKNLSPKQVFFNDKVMSRLSEKARERIFSEDRDFRQAIKELSPREREFYFHQDSASPITTRLRPGEFKDAFTDPSIRSIQVNNVIDPGMGTYDVISGLPELAGMKFDSAVNKAMLGNNVLVKDPSLLKYRLTGEEANFASGGSVAGTLRRMGQRAMSQAGDVDAVVAPRGALGVIKNKGGNWLTGSVEDALRGLKKEGLPPGWLNADNPDQRTIRQPLNNWIDKQLTRYVKNEMATPEDPIRALAERGVLHFDPGAVAEARRTVHPSGEVLQTLGQSPLAKAWEQTSDRFIAPETAGRFKVTRGQDGTTTVSRNPWLEKLPNDAAVYDTYESSRPSQLGFSHLTDELANALNPESGLPRHLLLDPASMSRVSVPQAVERVSQINAWRAAQKAEADALRANNAATVLHKEYPDKGFKWVELRQPEGLPEGYAIRQTEGGISELVSPKGEVMVAKSPEEATRMAWGDLRAQGGNPLADALKYEGDTMGHCVGGYCDDVASGRTKIYSLRDAKGQPHVTVEVNPSKKLSERDLPDDVRDMLAEAYGDASREEFEAAVAKAVQDRQTGDRIVQIKGKQNRAPNPEYLPFVQDFVKSGKWSDVGDLQNAGLTKVGDRFVSDAEAAALAERHFGGKWGNKPDADENPFQYFNRVNRYDEDMLSDADKAFIADWKAGNFASGGPVRRPPPAPTATIGIRGRSEDIEQNNPLSVEQLQAIIAQLRMEHSNA